MRLEQMVLGPLDVNTYIISADGSSDVAVIDPGKAKPIVAYLESQGLQCTHILITHGHFDHTDGAAALHEATGALLCIHKDDAYMLKSNDSSHAVFPTATFNACEPDILLNDGDVLDVAGLKIEVIHTPGHSPGGLCFVLRKEHVIFCGDTLFYESAGRTDFPGCSQRALYHSIVDKLYALEGDYDVYCGHDRATTLDHERANNPLTIYGKRFQW